MSVDDIRREEERSQRESEVEKRAYKKRKQEINTINDDPLAATDDDESNNVVVVNAAAKSDGRSAVESSIMVAPLLPEGILAASSKVADLAQQQQSMTIADLEEQVASLRKLLHQVHQNAEHWKRKYLEKVAVDRVVPAEVTEGQHLVQFATKAVEELMRSEDSYLCVSGRRSNRSCKEYQKAVGNLIWTNQSTFYECLCILLVGHVKNHLRQTVFHPAKILM